MMDDRSQTLRSPGSDAGREDASGEAERRRTERARQSHEEAFERLLGRCRGLEDEKLEWIIERRTRVDAQKSADDRAVEVEQQYRALGDRVRDLEAIDDRHREAAQAQQAERDRMIEAHASALAQVEARAEAAARTQQAERDRMTEAHASALAEVETREEDARHGLAQAEQKFRIEAYRLSALAALRSKEAEAAAAEAVAIRRRLELVLASTSWRVTRPIRVVSRLVRRASGLPRRAVRATWPRS